MFNRCPNFNSLLEMCHVCNDLNQFDVNNDEDTKCVISVCSEREEVDDDMNVLYYCDACGNVCERENLYIIMTNQIAGIAICPECRQEH